MFKDVITLIKSKRASDGAGGYEISLDSQNVVFANKKSVKQTEFYLAQQADLQAESIFKVNLFDYNDEKLIKHNEDYYSVIRTFIIGDFIELTCQRRIGGLDDVQMVKVNVRVEGTEATIRAVNMFDMKLKQDIIKLVRSTAGSVRKEGKARAPVAKTPVSKGSPGDLKASIRAKYFDGGLSATVVPRKPKGSHRHLVEYGTGIRRNKSGANRGKMPKIPFMGPAEQSSDNQYNSKLKGLVNRDETI